MLNTQISLNLLYFTVPTSQMLQVFAFFSPPYYGAWKKRTHGTIVAMKERAQVPNIGPQQTSYKRNSRTVGRVQNYTRFFPLKVESWKKHGELWKVWKMSNCFFLTSDDEKPRIPTNHWAYCSCCFVFWASKTNNDAARNFCDDSWPQSSSLVVHNRFF